MAGLDCNVRVVLTSCSLLIGRMGIGDLDGAAAAGKKHAGFSLAELKAHLIGLCIKKLTIMTGRKKK